MKYFAIIFSIGLGLHNTTHAASPPNMARQANFSILSAADSGYQFSIVDFADNKKQIRHRVYIGVPNAPPPEQGFPALFVLDGNAVLELLNANYLHQLANKAPVVLVLIGHSNSLRLDGDARAYDYTPTDLKGLELQDTLDETRTNGGAASFSQLLNLNIRPTVEKYAPLNANKQTLWGHSYGGLFVLYDLLHNSTPFNHYIAADPSLWWQYGLFFWQSYQQLNELKFQPSSILLTIHKSTKVEPKIAPNTIQQQRLFIRQQMMKSVPADAIQQLTYRLQQSGIVTLYEEYALHTHGSLFATSFYQALTEAAK